MSKKYYYLMPGFNRGKPGDKLVNFEDLVPEGRRVFDIDIRNPKMPDFPVPPRFLFDKNQGVLPGDAGAGHGLWFVSGATKRCMEKIAPASLEFAKCETVLPSGEEGPEYWFCLITKIIDAVDEEKSEVKIESRSDGLKRYNILGGAKILLKESLVDNTHLFRLKNISSVTVCDDYFKDSCEAAGLKLGWFRPLENL